MGWRGGGEGGEARRWHKVEGRREEDVAAARLQQQAQPGRVQAYVLRSKDAHRTVCCRPDKTGSMADSGGGRGANAGGGRRAIRPTVSSAPQRPAVQRVSNVGVVSGATQT